MRFLLAFDRWIGSGFGARVLHVVLFQPQIPPNTGNIGRLCAVTGSRLHLIHPLGFEITDRHLRRSGMDYWHQLDVRHHDDWAAFRAAGDGPSRLWLFTTRGAGGLWETTFEDGDGLVFGNEGHGSPDWLHGQFPASARVRIPQFNSLLRSLNLSTSVGIAVYEALRQCSIRGQFPASGEQVAPGADDRVS